MRTRKEERGLVAFVPAGSDSHSQVSSLSQRYERKWRGRRKEKG